MKIQNNFISAQKPAFGAFRIEKPQIFYVETPESLTKENNDKYKFRGTERFLHKETLMIKDAKKEIRNHSFPEPLEKILEIIKRQTKNPYDLVMYAKEYLNPEDDKIFLAIKDPEGNIIREREVYNAVNVVKNNDGEPNILSHFYTLLNVGEKLVEKYSNQS